MRRGRNEGRAEKREHGGKEERGCEGKKEGEIQMEGLGKGRREGRTGRRER